MIVPAMAVMALGTMVVVSDPGGAAIGGWQPGEHRGFRVHRRTGRTELVRAAHRDYDASVRFYEDVFKWDAYTMGDAPEFRYTTLGEGDDAARRHHGRDRLPAGRRAVAMVGLLRGRRHRHRARPGSPTSAVRPSRPQKTRRTAASRPPPTPPARSSNSAAPRPDPLPTAIVWSCCASHSMTRRPNVRRGHSPRITGRGRSGTRSCRGGRNRPCGTGGWRPPATAAR